MFPREFRYPRVVPVRPPTAAQAERHVRQRELVIASLLAQPDRARRTGSASTR